MGSSNSRAAGGSRQSRPRNRGLNQRREGRIRPLIRSLSCGTVFPRFTENEELPAENERNLTVIEDEDYGSELAMEKNFHHSTVSSENGHDRTELGTSGESSSSPSRETVTGSSGRGVDTGSGQASSSYSDSRSHHLGESSGVMDGNLFGIAGQIGQTTAVDLEASSSHLAQSSNIQGESSICTEGMRQLSTFDSELELSSPLEGGGSLANTRDFGDQSENSAANYHSALPDSMPAEGQLTGEEPVSQDLSRINPEPRESESRSMPHAEAVSLSSNESSSSTGHVSNQELRRNSRRRLWDALTRGTSRRRNLTPAILLATDDIDDLGSSNDRWLLDFSGVLYDDALEDDVLNTSRSSADSEERRWRFRSQVWALQRLRRGSDGASSGHSRFCASGTHADGHCSCEAYVMTEETSTHASISRIVMLAEALFEVLDEIHRQSVALSQSTSLSLVSLPAPESVVDSFPIRNHKNPEKNENVNDEAAQCYICLAEYEEGEKIRVLPCHHEYHMACVDKWLKEIHRVCPLCRGNVCEQNGANSEALNA